MPVPQINLEAFEAKSYFLQFLLQGFVPVKATTTVRHYGQTLNIMGSAPAVLMLCFYAVGEGAAVAECEESG